MLKTLSTAVSSVAPAYDDRKAYERKISTLVQRIASLLDGDPSDRRTGFDHMAFKVDTLMAVAFAIGLSSFRWRPRRTARCCLHKPVRFSCQQTDPEAQIRALGCPHEQVRTQCLPPARQMPAGTRCRPRG